MTDVIKRKPGRPKKVAPVEPQVVAEVEAVVPDVPLSPREVEDAKNVPVFPEGVGLEVPDIQDQGPVELSPAQVVALDHDFDGLAGGSRPHAKLTEHQVRAYVQNAVDAYEGQFEVKVVDGFNRIWAFRHETVKSRDHMLIECRRGPTVAQRFISTAVFTQGQAMVAIEEADAETSR